MTEVGNGKLTTALMATPKSARRTRGVTASCGRGIVVKAQTVRDAGRQLRSHFAPESLRDQGRFVMSQLASGGTCTWTVHPEARNAHALEDDSTPNCVGCAHEWHEPNTSAPVLPPMARGYTLGHCSCGGPDCDAFDSAEQIKPGWSLATWPST
jgi:hypothetical protein